MVEKLHAAVSYEHKLRFMPSPTENPSIKLLMKAVRRKFTKPRNPVQPLDLSHLLQLNLHLENLEKSDNLIVWRTVWRMNMLYYTMCRFSEINCLKINDVQIHQEPSLHISIQICKSKTDQNGQGDIKYLYPVTNNKYLCPVRLTQKYLDRLSLHLGAGHRYQGYLQPRVHRDVKRNMQIPIPDKLICYSTSLEESKALLGKLGILGRFGEHSGRRGGASAAAQNGASIQEVQVLGNWKSSSCAQKYVEQTASQKEKISRLLYPSCEDGSAEQGPDVFANSAMLSPK
jgi:integrase